MALVTDGHCQALLIMLWLANADCFTPMPPQRSPSRRPRCTGLDHPKKTSGVESDLSREAVWAAMEGTGWRPVSQIAIDEIWPALRFRPTEDASNRAVTFSDRKRNPQLSLQ